MLKDSLKIGVEYKVKYTLNDEQALSLKYDQINNDTIVISDDFVKISPATEGENIIKLFAKDVYGETGQAELDFTVFRNLLPVCKADIRTINEVAHEIEISAAHSYDRDAKWGGKIVQYEYKIQQDYFLQTNLNKIRYIFQSAGQKKITVRVQDNNGEWSDAVIKYVNVSK
jgi:hypothetical protein